MARLGDDADLEDVLRDALADDALAVVLPAPDGWVRPDGAPAPRPRPEPAQPVTELRRDGAVVALVQHRRLGARQARLLSALHDAFALAAVNARLGLDLEQAAREARRSRSEVVATADRARRRVERDLHDGAQQRLVATSLAVQLMRMDLDNARLDRALAAVAAEVQAALAELRRLARGVYPAILSEQGLAAALATLAEESVVPVRVLAAPQGRLPVEVETAAYFAVVAVSTATSGTVDVTAVVRDGALHVRLVGVAVEGEHLLALQDRVVAAGGRLETASAPPALLLGLPIS